MTRRLRIAVFIDHDVMIRHFFQSGVFLPLFETHDVDVVIPPIGYKRVSIDPTPYIGHAKLVHLPVHAKRRALWGHMMQVLVMRPKFDRYSLDLRRTWRLVLPLKVELFHTLLGMPLIFSLYKKWTWWQAAKQPNRAMQDLLDQGKYDAIINPGLPDGHYIDDLMVETKARGIPFIYIMNSWDNPSTGPFAAGKPDLFLAWGPQTVEHAILYQGMAANKVIPFGAAQFEIYRSPPRIDRAEFCRRHNVRPEQHLILYAGGSLGTNEFEHLQLLECAIADGRYGDAVVIYRPHPWGGGGNAGEQIVDHDWTHVRIESTMRAYLESLRSKGYHMTFPDYADTHDVLSAVDCVISPLSTILIEAAMHGKPIMCFLPLEDVVARHFQTVHCLPHFRDLQEDPNVVLAKGRKEFVEKVPTLFDMVADPKFADHISQTCNFFVTHHDKSYSSRLVDLVEKVATNGSKTADA